MIDAVTAAGAAQQYVDRHRYGLNINETQKVCTRDEDGVLSTWRVQVEIRRTYHVFLIDTETPTTKVGR